MTSGARGPRDDFFCWKFRVWYNLEDCAFRHAYGTTEDCAACEQGAANLKVLGSPPPPPRWAEILSVSRRRVLRRIRGAAR
ncbi:MAG: hypothetical protein D6718_08250 [Acidobacteria bacterium]|nr:MAG: hypothetical protein D6718_08250 [Acidobacteriota bacterium]